MGGRGMRALCRNNKGKLVVVAVLLLWISGLTDHLFATSFAEFSWPPQIHLRSKVEQLIRSGKSMGALPNLWSQRLRSVPECGGLGDVDKSRRLLVIIKSAAKNFEARGAIRKTWGKESREGGWGLRFVFVLGFSPDRSIMDEVEKEAKEKGDILQSNDFVDQYYNNGKKFGLSLWLSTASPLAEKCHPGFILLIDDDYMMERGNLIALLSSRRHDEPLYEGWMMDSSPFRFRLHKHRVSLADYPFDAYPPYITAGAVLMSANTAERFYYGSLYVKLFAFDDVYAGILAKLLSILPQHNDGFLYWSNAGSKLDWTKTIAAHGFSPADIKALYPPRK